MQSSRSLPTAVLLIIYKRPKETEQVLTSIAQVRPKKLFVAADGPRNEEDKAKCLAARAVVDKIDWECEVYKNYSDINLKLRERVVSALNWAFEQTDELIILEDDVVADSSFFWFCSELLERYRDDPQVMHIAGGNNLVITPSYAPPQESYFFGRYAHIWGWATWRRAWQRSDPQMQLWTNATDADKAIFLQHFDRQTKQFWSNLWDYASSDYASGWAYRWMFACFAHNGLCINPRDNLITNIGFGPEAAHTTKDHSIAHLPCHSISFPLSHPNTATVHERLDREDGLFLWRLLDPPKPLSQQLYDHFKHYLRRAKRKLSSIARKLFAHPTT